MRTLPVRREVLFAVWLLLFLGSCSAKNEDVAFAVGNGECSLCARKNIQKFKDLHVSIGCKGVDGKMDIKGSSELDKDGKFTVELPSDLLKENGQLKHDCYAQLHSASNDLCPTKNGPEASKLVLKSHENGKRVFTTAGKLDFSPELCASATFLPKFKLPPLPKINCPPFKKYFTFPPFHKKFFPPTVPIYKPPVPIYKPPVPIYKPPVPIYKPPVPIYKPPVPIYKPPVIKKPPVYKPPVIKKPPVYKPPVIKKPPVYKPPVIEKPPVYKPPVIEKPPVYKPPVIEKPPVYKPPVIEKPPFYKHPIFKKPPFFKFPPKKPCPPIFKKHFPKLKFPSYPPLPPHPWVPPMNVP